MFQFIIFYSLTNFLRLFLITVFTVAIFEILVDHRIYIYEYIFTSNEYDFYFSISYGNFS